MPSPQNSPSDGANPGQTRLDSALDYYLLANRKPTRQELPLERRTRPQQVFDWGEK